MGISPKLLRNLMEAIVERHLIILDLVLLTILFSHPVSVPQRRVFEEFFCRHSDLRRYENWFLCRLQP